MSWREILAERRRARVHCPLPRRSRRPPRNGLPASGRADANYSRVEGLVREEGMKREAAVRIVMNERGVSRSTVFAALKTALPIEHL
jgi:hypothetical protein